MPLRAIVRALGGDLYDGGRRANVPAPGHSRQDRSVSLLWSEGRVVVHCFGKARWRDVLGSLRASGLVDALGAPATKARATERPSASRAERTAVAAQLWAQARAIAGTLGEQHLRDRAIRGPLPQTLRFHPAVSLAVYVRGRAAMPALLAAITDPSGALTAVEITYLEPNGRRASQPHLSRKTVGVVPLGSAVRLAPAAETMVVAEGVATALSAGERFGRPAWALLGARNLRAWTPPPAARRIVVAGDRGDEGEAAASALADRLRRRGIASAVALPRAPFGDWNDVAKAEGKGGERLRLRGWGGPGPRRPEPP